MHRSSAFRLLGAAGLVIALGLALGVAATSLTAARPALAAADQLSIEDWLAVQGTACFDLDSDSIPCEEPDDLFLPPSPNYLGWSGNDRPDGTYDKWGAVDYAGLSARWLRDVCPAHIDLGTTSTGSVTARDIGDGQVLVSVRLHTKNALGWAAFNLAPGDDGNAAPVTFGSRTAEICYDGATPALMDANLNIEYYADASTPLVDFLSWPAARSLDLSVSGSGTFADGSPGRMTIRQTGNFQTHSHAAAWDGFPVEFLELRRVGR